MNLLRGPLVTLARPRAHRAARGLAVGFALLGAAGAPSEARAQETREPARHASPFLPDTVFSPPGGPRIVFLTSPGEGVAALRLAVPLREGPLEAGAGMLLRDLALERMRTLARPVGAEVSASRTPWGVAYAVTGAAADFEYLAYLLREAVASPDVSGPGFPQTRNRLREAAATAVETPLGRLAADLRAQAAPGLAPSQGTPASVAALDGGRVREVWLRTHQASAMTLVVSAPIAPEVALAATRGMGAPEGPVAPPPDAPAPSAGRRPAPQALRSWYGQAWPAGEPGDPHPAVAALLVADRLREATRGFEASVELWELPDRWVLATLGGAHTRQAQAMRRAISEALASARAGLDAGQVSAAVARLRSDLMVRSRTPMGLVAAVGRAMEAGGDPHEAARRAAALDAVDLESTRRYLDDVARRTPYTAQVRP